MTVEVKPAKRIIRDVKKEISDLRTALVNHCVNWRDIFTDAKSIDDVSDNDLYSLYAKINGILYYTKPWIANSKDETYSFRVVNSNLYNPIFSLTAIDNLVVDIASALSMRSIRVSVIRSAHLRKPVFTVTFFDLTYSIIRGMKIVELFNNIVYNLTGVSGFSNFNRLLEKKVVIFNRSWYTRSTGGAYLPNTNTLYVNSQRCQYFSNIDKVVLFTENFADLCIPKVSIVLKNSKTTSDIVTGMKDVADLFFRSIRSIP